MPPKPTPGFSLTEILIVLTLLSITLLITWPSQKNSLQTSSAQLTGAQLFHAVQIARTQAILQNKIITLCPSADQRTCTGSWQEGYIIKSDNKILNALRFTVKAGVIYWKHYPFYRNTLEFLPNGFSNLENGTFYFCAKENKHPLWAIVINQSGRARFLDDPQQEDCS